MASAIESQLAVLEDNIRRVTALNSTLIFSRAQSFPVVNGMSANDLKEAFENLCTNLAEAKTLGAFAQIPFSILGTLTNFLAIVSTQGQNFINNQSDQNSYNQFAVHVDAARISLLQNGIYSLVKWAPSVQTTTDLKAQLAVLTGANDRVESLEMKLSGLLTPALAGRLSESFNDRKKWLFKGRVVLAIAVVASLAIAAILTSKFAVELHDLLQPENLQKQGLSVIAGFIALRAALFVPIYLLVYFVSSQYIKERNLEEEYAHKETVSSVLATYGDLLTDPAMKNTMFARISDIVFSSPVSREEGPLVNIGRKELDLVEQVVKIGNSAKGIVEK